MRYAWILTVSLVLTFGYCACARASEYPAKVPHLELRAWWAEQEIETNTVHKLRIPRGGMVDIIATIEPGGVDLKDSRVEITVTPPLELTGLLLDGEQITPETSVEVDLAEPRQLRWTFQTQWEPRKAHREYRFDVTVPSPPRRWRGGREKGYRADLKKSVTIEQGVSCWDTTAQRRIEQLAKSPYCKLENIGKSVLGRDMYLLRASDWSVLAEKKKQLIVIGPYHGDEPSGQETVLDFLHEIFTDPQKKHYLEEIVFYIFPSHNPDGHEVASHWGTHKIDPGNHSYNKLDEVPEAANVEKTLRKYQKEFTDPMAIVHHEWGADYILISHMDVFPRAKAGSWQLIQNMCVKVSNELDKPMYPIYAHYTEEGYTGVRGFMTYVQHIPNYTLENTGHSQFNLAVLMESIIPELAIYYATLDQMLHPAAVAPKVHPPKDVTFPPERNYKAYRTDTPPVIDGELHEDCWGGESIITGFARTGRRRGSPGETTVHIAYDDENIYFAFDVPDLEKSDITGRDVNLSLSGQDACEIALDTNLNQWTWFQFAVNANGAFCDTYFRCAGIHDPDAFNIAEYKLAGSVENGAIELSIPLKAFNHPGRVDPPIAIPIPDGTVWGTNFLRTRTEKHSASTWARIRGRNTERPWGFNAITFAGKKPK